jgi:hypothetical protein
MSVEESIEYRFFLTDLLSNEIISEVPFKNISYSRELRRAGKFSGKIPFAEATKGLNLYEATMPGRTGLYVMRNNVCVWGGIIWSRSYKVDITGELNVEASEFISYFYKRSIWQTLVYGTEFIGVFSYSINSNLATITTEQPHGFTAGDRVRVTFTSPLVDGIRTIKQVTAFNQFTFDVASSNVETTLINTGTVRGLVDTFDFVRDILGLASVDLAGINFANEEIEPAQRLEVSIISKQRSNNVVTLTTQEPHNLVIGQEVNVFDVGNDLDGLHIVTDLPNNNTIIYELLGPDVPRTTLSGIKTINVATKALSVSFGAVSPETPAIATITLAENHGASVGQKVLLQGVDSFFSGILDKRYNGLFEIQSIPTPTSFTYTTSGVLGEPTTSVVGGLATFGSRLVYGTYGSFTYNGDISLDITNETSGLYQDQKIYRGYELKSIGDILEEYSENINGFEYRIDCDYDFNTASFTRNFVLLDLSYAAELEEGGIADIARFGADEYVFELPGNIFNFEIEESAEEAATRMFTIGKIDDISGDSSQPYAAASAPELLSNPLGKSWPILDETETVDGVSDEAQLYQYAKDYLYESLPPISDFKLEVNGSLSPYVGTYSPGDFCSIIVDDQFVRERLASDAEPRDDILIRKIAGYKVKVPNSPHYPERVELDLIIDWKAEDNGN